MLALIDRVLTTLVLFLLFSCAMEDAVGLKSVLDLRLDCMLAIECRVLCFFFKGEIPSLVSVDLEALLLSTRFP